MTNAETEAFKNWGEFITRDLQRTRRSIAEWKEIAKEFLAIYKTPEEFSLRRSELKHVIIFEFLCVMFLFNRCS